MNERIQELIEESTTISDDLVYDGENSFIETVESFDMEKFAKLIIRECADIAYEYDAPKMSGPGMIIAGRIETHFGVEE